MRVGVLVGDVLVEVGLGVVNQASRWGHRLVLWVLWQKYRLRIFWTLLQLQV